jgi:hypothetical protein
LTFGELFTQRSLFAIVNRVADHHFLTPRSLLCDSVFDEINVGKVNIARNVAVNDTTDLDVDQNDGFVLLESGIRDEIVIKKYII